MGGNQIQTKFNSLYIYIHIWDRERLFYLCIWAGKHKYVCVSIVFILIHMY